MALKMMRSQPRLVTTHDAVTTPHVCSLLTRAIPIQVCKREDSETYAKRTITEIETCLGFRFQHGAPEEEAAETMNNDEIEVRYHYDLL